MNGTIENAVELRGKINRAPTSLVKANNIVDGEGENSLQQVGAMVKSVSGFAEGVSNKQLRSQVLEKISENSYRLKIVNADSTLGEKLRPNGMLFKNDTWYYFTNWEATYEEARVYTVTFNAAVDLAIDEIIYIVEGINLMNRSHTEGGYNTTYPKSGDDNAAHAEGEYNLATGASAHAEGRQTYASGSQSHSEGALTKATEYCSHAEGVKTRSSGQGSHTEGGYTEAYSNYSHAEGHETMASSVAPYSHAEGKGTRTSGEAAHAEGKNTQANAEAAHAEGIETKAHNRGSHAGGIGTYASRDGQMSIGKYNGTTSGSLFVVGNGTSDSNRSNAFAVQEDGSIKISGHPLFMGTLTAATQLDTKFEAGFYKVSSSQAISGINDRFGTLLVMPYKGDTLYYSGQLFLCNGDSSSNKNSLFFRTYNGHEWNAWQRINPQQISKTEAQAAYTAVATNTFLLSTSKVSTLRNFYQQGLYTAAQIDALYDLGAITDSERQIILGNRLMAFVSENALATKLESSNGVEYYFDNGTVQISTRFSQMSLTKSVNGDTENHTDVYGVLDWANRYVGALYTLSETVYAGDIVIYSGLPGYADTYRVYASDTLDDLYTSENMVADDVVCSGERRSVTIAKDVKYIAFFCTAYTGNQRVKEFELWTAERPSDTL